MQRRDYARSEGCEQPINESLHDSSFDPVLGVKAVDVSGPSSANRLVSSQDSLFVKTIQRCANCSVSESARRMQVLSDLTGRSISKPDNCPKDSRLKISELQSWLVNTPAAICNFLFRSEQVKLERPITSSLSPGLAVQEGMLDMTVGLQRTSRRCQKVTSYNGIRRMPLDRTGEQL